MQRACGAPSAARQRSSPTMMSRPRTDLRYSIIGADVVCLDLTTSRYFLLQGAAAEAFKAATFGTATCGRLRWLVENNLVEAGPPAPGTRIAPRPARADFDKYLEWASAWTCVASLR